MTIKQQGGIFGRNPTFNDVEVEGTLTVNGEPISDFGTMAQQDADSVNIDGGAIDGTVIGANSAAAITGTVGTFNTSLDVNGDIEIGAGGSGTKQVYVNGSGSSTSVMEVLMRGGGTGNPTSVLRHSSSTKAFNVLTGNYGAEAARLTVAGTGSGDVTVNTGNLVIGTSGKGIDFGSNTLVDVNNGVPVSKTVGSSVTDVAHITTTSGGYTNFIFEVYAFSSGNNMPAKGTILARGYSGGWATVELKDEQLSGTTPINLSVGNSGADLIVKATQPNSSTLTMFIKSIYKTNVSITVA